MYDQASGMEADAVVQLSIRSTTDTAQVWRKRAEEMVMVPAFRLSDFAIKRSAQKSDDEQP